MLSHSMEALAATPFDPMVTDKSANLHDENMTTTWGNYFYQNLLHNLQTSGCIRILNHGGNDGLGSAQGGPTARGAAAATGFDLSPTRSANTNSVGGQAAQPLMSRPGPSNYYMNYYSGCSAPSVLAPSANGSVSSNSNGVGTLNIPSSQDLVENIVASPSLLGVSPGRLDRNDNRRIPSMDSEAEGDIDAKCDIDADGDIDPDAETRSQYSNHSEPDSMHDHDDGVEHDGMIWGMNVDVYRALSARERKRVRNRISARTFRAKRKEHLRNFELTIGAKNLEVKLAHEENMRLRNQLAELKRRLSKYEPAPVS